MNVPETMVIFGRRYAVDSVSPYQSSEGILGLAAYRDGVIYLDRGLDPALLLSTLWHEAAHVAQQELLGVVDEAQARWIALFVHNVLVHNPWIAEWYAASRSGPPAALEDTRDNNCVCGTRTG